MERTTEIRAVREKGVPQRTAQMEQWQQARELDAIAHRNPESSSVTDSHQQEAPCDPGLIARLELERAKLSAWAEAVNVVYRHRELTLHRGR